MNAEYAEKGWKTKESVVANRLSGWRETAFELVIDHPLEEVIAIIDWVFATRDGQLPASAVEKKRDLKLTRLRQIQRGWDALVEAIAAPVAATAPAIRKVDVNDRPVTHIASQSQVDDLVELFRDFRSRVVSGSGRDTDITDARALSWAKTFRIMLAQHSFDDIKAVIDAVRECPEDVDQRRYSNAYDLNRPGEWEILQGLVGVHESVKANKFARSSMGSAPKAEDSDDRLDDDDDWGVTRRRFRRTDPDNDPGGDSSPGRPATDFSSPESIARRRARYLSPG